MSKIFSPIIALFKFIYKIIDKFIVVPISRLVYRLNELSRNNSGKFEKILNRPNVLIYVSLLCAIALFILIDSKTISLVSNEAEVLTDQVVNVIYNFYKNIETKYPDFVQIIREKSNNSDYPLIIVPCNFSFCRHKEKITRLENLIEQYKNDIDLAFGFSYSGDGKYVTDTRERTEVSDELYDTIFSLMKR